MAPIRMPRKISTCMIGARSRLVRQRRAKPVKRSARRRQRRCDAVRLDVGVKPMKHRREADEAVHSPRPARASASSARARATKAPIAPPMITIGAEQPVVAGAAEDRGETASAMPIMPYRLPRLRLLLVGEAAEAQDEEDRRGRGRQAVDKSEAHGGSPQLFRNMASMRRVTGNPPKMLTRERDQRRQRRRPGSGHEPTLAERDLQQRAEDDDRRDPLVIAISGVCSAWRHVPDHMKPTKQASAKTMKCCMKLTGATVPTSSISTVPTTSSAVVRFDGLVHRRELARRLLPRRSPPAPPASASAARSPRSSAAAAGR